MARNDDSIDFTPNSRSNNNKNMRASKSNVENENRDILEGLNLQSKKIEEVNRKKLDGEKKVTAEKQKQNKEDDKQLKLQNQQANMIRSFQKTQDQIIKSQYNQTEILKSIAILMDNSKKSMEEELKHQRELLKEQKEKTSAMQDYYDKLNKNYDEQKSYEKQLSEMAKSHADFQGQELKKLQSHQIGLWKQQQKNLKDQQDLQQAINSGYMKSTDEIKRRFTELKDIQEDIAREQEETAKRIERSKALADKRTGLKNQAFKGFGINTDSDIFKYFSQRRTASPEDKKFLAASAKLEVASVAIETATKAVMKFATLWLDRFTAGMDRIVGVYEDTYSEVAAISGVNESGYTKWQTDTVSLLREQGVDNAVTISQAMTELHRLTKEGFTDMNKSSEMAIQNIQNRVINPFVDTTTEAYENLQYQLGSKFTKQIAGMSSYLADISGSNRVFKSSINDVIDKLEPMALSAEKDLLGDAYTYVEDLVNAKVMTQKQAIEFVSSSVNGMADPYAALTGGDVTLAAAVANGKYGSLKEMMLSRLGTASLVSSSNPIMQGAGLQGITGSSNGAFGPYTPFDKAISTIAKTSEKNSKTNKKAEDYYDIALKRLQNGDLTTALQEKANVAENVAVYAATLREQWPDAYEILKGILEGLGKIALAVLAGHAMSGFGNLAGGLGKGGMLKAGATALGGKLAAVGGGSTLAGTAAVVAPLAAGTAIGAYGIKKGIDDLNTQDHKVRGGLSIVGGAAAAAGGIGVAGGMLAAGAANAWNPVGWGLLIAGGVTVLATALHRAATEAEEHANALKDTTENNKAMAKDIKAEWDSINKTIQDEADTRVQSLKDMKSDLKAGRTLEATRKELIDSGIMTEEDINVAREADKESLEKLVDKYITETNRLSQDAQDFNNIFSDYEQNVVGGARNEIARFLNDHKGNEKNNANYDPVYDAVKAAVDRTYEKQRNGGSLSKAEENLLDKWKWASEDNDVSRSDLKSLINKVGDQSIAQMLTEEDLDSLARGRSGSKYGEHMTNYREQALDDGIISLLQNAYNSVDKDSAVAYLNQAGYRPDTSVGAYNDAIRKILDKVYKDGKQVQFDYDEEKYYRSGTNYVPYNGLRAILHKGESVLTASATSDLKEFLGTENIKDFSGEVMNQTLSSGLGSFSSVIADQTRVLVNKIDEVIMTIRDGRTGVLTSVMTDAEREQFAL